MKLRVPDHAMMTSRGSTAIIKAKRTVGWLLFQTGIVNGQQAFIDGLMNDFDSRAGSQGQPQNQAPQPQSS